MKFGKMLSDIKRADVKSLGEAVINGDSYYKEELERIKSRDVGKKLEEVYSGSEAFKKYIFDISEVYDLWFKGNETDDRQN